MTLGFLVIVEGLGLALIPRQLAFLAGPGAHLERNLGWTRLQGTGFMLLGSSFVVSAASNSSSDVPAVLVLAMAACVMFSMSVMRRGRN